MTLAYLDANSGSLIASAAAAGFAGAAVAARLGWQRVSGKFSRKADPSPDDAGTGAPAEG